MKNANLTTKTTSELAAASTGAALPSGLAVARVPAVILAGMEGKVAANDGTPPSGSPGASASAEAAPAAVAVAAPEETLAFAAPSGKLRAEVSLAKVEGGWVVGRAYQSLRGSFFAEKFPPAANGAWFPSRAEALEFGLDRLARSAEADRGAAAPSPDARRDFERLDAWAAAQRAAVAAPAPADPERPLAGAVFIDLFAGIGGFHAALKELGARCGAAVELDPAAAETYKANHGSGFQFHADIRDLDPAALPKAQIVAGGFPCPAFSLAGDQAGYASPSGALFFEVVRVVRAARPELVLLENVEAFATHDGGRTAAKAMDLLAEAGYAVSLRSLDASRFGLPQKRERIFVVARRLDRAAANDPFIFPEGSDVPSVVEDILEKGVKAAELPAPMKKVDGGPVRGDRMNLVGLVGGKNMQGYRVYSTKGKGATLCAASGGPGRQTALYLVGGKARRLTPRECARMQGFPESFKPNPNANAARKQFGNAVAVPVVSAVAAAAASFL